MKVMVIFTFMIVYTFGFIAHSKLTPYDSLKKSTENAKISYYRVKGIQNIPVYGSTDASVDNICGWLEGGAFVEAMTTETKGMLRLLISTPLVEIDPTLNDCGSKKIFYISESELGLSLFAE